MSPTVTQAGKFRLSKCFSLSEQKFYQAEDERHLADLGRSWVGQMSAAWEVLDFPGLALSKEPPPTGRGDARWSFWIYGDGSRQEVSTAWDLQRRLRGQSFQTRREALQALEMAWQQEQAERQQQALLP